MNQFGHHITAAALGIAGAAIAVQSGLPVQGALFFVGAFAGASAPDWLELPFSGGRVIPHRTLTHVPWLWLVALLWVAVALHGSWLWPVVLGFILASLLHLAMDSLSPMGIPLANPGGRRYSLHLYHTGGLSEAATIAGTVGAFALVAIGITV